MLLGQLAVLFVIGGSQSPGPTIAVIDPSDNNRVRQTSVRSDWHPADRYVRSLLWEGRSKPPAFAVAVFDASGLEPSVALGASSDPVLNVVLDDAHPHSWVAFLGEAKPGTTLLVGWSTDPWRTVSTYDAKGRTLTHIKDPGFGSDASKLRIVVSNKDFRSGPRSNEVVVKDFFVEVRMKLPERLLSNAVRMIAIDRQGTEVRQEGETHFDKNSWEWSFRRLGGAVTSFRLQVRRLHWMPPLKVD